jgi:hypothetical protein
MLPHQGWIFIAALISIAVVQNKDVMDHCGQRRQFFAIA